MSEKRKCFIPAALLVCSAFLSGAAGAGEIPGNEALFSYEEQADGTLILTGYSGGEADLFIPAELGEKAVGAIGDSCFAGCIDLQRVHIPEGITQIGDYAFESCTAMEKVYFPDSLVSIGDGAFSGCASLMLADMQDGIESIGRGAFLYCTSLVNLDLSEDLKELGEFAFAGCSGLSKADLSDSGVQVLPDRLFYGCGSLAGVLLPKGVTSVGKRAFSGCEKLESLYFPGKLDQVSGFAFENCSGLKNINLPVETLPEKVLGGCSSLNSFSMDPETRSIGFAAFALCGLENLFLGDGVEEIAEGAFYQSQVKSVYADEACPYSVVDGCLYADGGKTLFAWFPEDPYAEEPQTSFTVPEGVETIAPYAFAGSSLEEVKFPGSLKEIGAFAFVDSSLRPEIPEGVQVSAGAFGISDETESAEEQDADAASAGLQEGDAEERESDGAGSEDASGTAETASAEGEGGTDNAEDPYVSAAGSRSIFDAEQFADYEEIPNDRFDAWSEEYLAANVDAIGDSIDYSPYVMMYKGEVIPYFMGMTAVQNHDPEMWAMAVNNFGDDFEQMFLMMNHGLFTELRRGRMTGDLILYSGVYDSQLMAAAGTETVPTQEELVNAIGNTFTDSVMISTTTDPFVACNFSDTLFVIYASREAMEELGAISIDSFIHTNEKEILMTADACYRVLDVGSMTLEEPQEEGDPVVHHKNYVRVELLGTAAESDSDGN